MCVLPVLNICNTLGKPDHPGRLPESHREARGVGSEEGELHLHVPVQGEHDLLRMFIKE